jgi:hypothetical protein
MKTFYRILVCIILLTSFFTAKSQLKKGDVMLGADIAHLDLSLNEGNFFTASLDPKFARFLKDNFALGGFINFHLITAKGEGTSVLYRIGPLARYYFGDPNVSPVRQARFFVEGNVGINGSNPAHGNSTNGLGLGVGPGIAYFFTPNIGLETLLKYEGIIGFGSSVTSSNLTLAFGAQIYLPHKTLEEAAGMKK